MRPVVFALAALVFCGGLLFETTALLQLAWIGLRGGFGLGLWCVPLAAVLIGLALAWQSRRPPKRQGKRKGRRGAPAKRPKRGKRKSAKPVTARRRNARPARNPARGKPGVRG